MSVPRILHGLTALLALTPGLGAASSFDVNISPPRFEVKARPGKVFRDIVKITNLDKVAGLYVVKTADWDLSEAGQLTFNEGTPQQGSCRPWVRIERHQVKVRAGATKSYRFEVHVPAEAPAGECRFALLISQDPATVKPMSMGTVSVPVVGRVAVIAYLAIGDAAPALQFQRLQLQQRRGKPMPVAMLKNVGQAHGRPFGSLTATDRLGRKLELVVAETPILPGQTRAIELRPVDWSQDGAVDVTFAMQPPVRIRGRISWDGGSVRLDEVLR